MAAEWQRSHGSGKLTGMSRFAAHLGWQFAELPFLDRFAAAAEAGFQAVEFPFPYDHPAELLATRAAEHELQQVSIMAPAGDWPGGERGIAALPGREQEFRDGLNRALDYAVALGCPSIHIAAGLVPPEVERARAMALYREHLALACDRALGHGITILIEPVSRKTYPSFLITATVEAESVLAELDRPNLKLLFDLWHTQLNEGDLTRTLTRVMPKIGHIQLANPPGRNEPGCGELNFSYLFALIDRLGYGGWIGLEYRPSRGTLASLDWARAHGLGLAAKQ